MGFEQLLLLVEFQTELPRKRLFFRWQVWKSWSCEKSENSPFGRYDKDLDFFTWPGLRKNSDRNKNQKWSMDWILIQYSFWSFFGAWSVQVALETRIKACQGNDFQWYCPLEYLSEYEIKRVCTVTFHTLYDWNVQNNLSCFMVRCAYVQRFYTFQSDYLSIINHVICTSMTLDSHAIAAIQSYFGVPIYLSTRQPYIAM